MSLVGAQINSKNLANARSYLSAAVTNKVTCLEGLDSSFGAEKQGLLNSIHGTYQHISNALSIVAKKHVAKKNVAHGRKNRRLMGFPRWLSKRDRRILDVPADEFGSSQVLTVAADGTGNFSYVMDAIEFAPNNSDDRIVVYVKEGVYMENVVIPSWKTNIFLVGDGNDVTTIIANRSVGGGWTTYRSATFAVNGEGFLARDIAFWNSAGPENHQAVALRISADFAALYRCAILGYQDTLYVHSFRQFYRDSDIYGTIDYIFGNAAVVFQNCNLISRLPLPGQFIAITAQSRDSPDEFTGIAFQNCSILATEDLYSNSSVVKCYLGRPWKNYSTTVYMESYIDDFVSPEGWTNWSGDDGLTTLYYGEYDNNGPGAVTDGRVTWEGYHVMDYDDAQDFTVSELIDGDEWLDSTSFPYDDGV